MARRGEMARAPGRRGCEMGLSPSPAVGSGSLVHGGSMAGAGRQAGSALRAAASGQAGTAEGAAAIPWGLSVISCGAGIVGWKETPHAATQTARNRRRAA